MEIISGPVAAPLQHVVASVTAPPDAAATERFTALMQAPAIGAPGKVDSLHAAGIPAAGIPAPGIPAPGVHAPDPALPPAPANVGDRILGGMQKVSQEFRDSWTQVSAMLRAGSPALDMQAMLKLQLHLTQASVQYDMLGKAVSRSTQNFDQLVRVQ